MTSPFATSVAPYPDGRPVADLRLDARDHGPVLRHGHGPDGCDRRGAREASVFAHDGYFWMFYDGAGPDGWRACLARSTDLVNWDLLGPVLNLGEPGTPDSAAATSPWVYFQDGLFHMFYLGTPSASPAPDHVPQFPYLTLKAVAERPEGPWRKDYNNVPFSTVPGTYRGATASPGYIVRVDGTYLQYFSASCEIQTPEGIRVERTLGLARAQNLEGPWEVLDEPILPLEEQIENSSVYYDQTSGLWFLFTNHIGCEHDPVHGLLEYTDAVWVYWSSDPLNWNPANKAVVIDGLNCPWSHKVIGMPTVIPFEGRLAVLYDAPGGDSTSHMHRDIGLAWLDLPLTLPERPL